MDLLINGKTALVTGSTAGIGFAIAAELAREGAAVVINGRRPSRPVQAAAPAAAANNPRIRPNRGSLGIAPQFAATKAMAAARPRNSRRSMRP